MSLQKNFSLKALNTFGIDAKAQYYTLIQDIPTLRKLLLQEAIVKHLPKLVLGGGSNILFVQDFAGWVIQLGIMDIEQIYEDNTSVYIKAGAGLNWHKLVEYCIQNNYAGIENLSLIPGTVGGASLQNIGAYGVELSQVLASLEAMEIQTGTIQTFHNQDCHFGYRESIFKKELKNQYIILSITLRLQKEPEFKTDYGSIQETLASMQVKELSIQAISKAIVQIRQGKLPNFKQVGNAGSFFQNPVLETEQLESLQQHYPDLVCHALPQGKSKISAAWLIEKSDWKGYREGQVGVDPNHALVLVNYGGATGQEVYQLAQKIQKSVQTQFGISLTPEVAII
jgi:UDP-N-acetylmuramate dehydrogenase